MEEQLEFRNVEVFLFVFGAFFIVTGILNHSSSTLADLGLNTSLFRISLGLLIVIPVVFLSKSKFKLLYSVQYFSLVFALQLIGESIELSLIGVIPIVIIIALEVIVRKEKKSITQ